MIEKVKKIIYLYLDNTYWSFLDSVLFFKKSHSLGVFFYIIDI